MDLNYRVAFNEIHSVLIDEWDPIGVNDAPEAQDEYDSYIPDIFRLMRLSKRSQIIWNPSRESRSAFRRTLTEKKKIERFQGN